MYYLYIPFHGVEDRLAEAFESLEDAKQKAAQTLCALLTEGDALLIKASRGVRLEEVYNTIKQQLSK